MSKKVIEVSSELRKEIEKLFGLKRSSISNILSYKRNSELAERVREYALMNGGQVVQIDVTPIETPMKKVKILDVKGRVKAERNL